MMIGGTACFALGFIPPIDTLSAIDFATGLIAIAVAVAIL